MFLELLDPCETAWIPFCGPFVGLPRKLEVFLCLWLGSGSLLLAFGVLLNASGVDFDAFSWFLMVSEWFWQLLRCFCGFFPVSP